MAGEYPPTRFALLRHAETEWNQNRRIQGQNNSPLTSEGENQAKQWGQLLKPYRWNRIIASDAARALETTALVNIALKVPVIRDSRLREQDWGQWTGKTVAQLKEEAPQFLADMEAAGWQFCPPAGEDRDAVWKRSQGALKDAHEKWRGEKILLITHEGVIKCLIYRLCGRKFLPTEPPILVSNHLHWLAHDREGLRIEEINALELP